MDEQQWQRSQTGQRREINSRYITYRKQMPVAGYVHGPSAIWHGTGNLKTHKRGVRRKGRENIMFDKKRLWMSVFFFFN